MKDPLKSTKALETILRTDFRAFAQKAFAHLNPGQVFSPNWAFEAVGYALEQCVLGGLRRLIVCQPPRHLKSVLASTALPAWVLGRDPKRRLICVSYSQDLAKKFHQDCHNLIESDFYQKVFPGMHLAKKPNNDQEYATTAHGFRLATSVGGTLTGRGGDFIIIDDPIKPTEAQSEAERRKLHGWFSDTLITRLDNPSEGVVIIVTQRTHVDDLVGYVKDRGDWTTINIPAINDLETQYQVGPDKLYTRPAKTLIDPSRQTMADLMSLKKSMTDFFFAAQFQQDPVVPGGGVLKFSWFDRLENMPPRGDFNFVAQVWDTASESGEHNDYSVCGTFGVIRDSYYLLDVFRARLGYTDLRANAFRLIGHWRPDIIAIENSGVGFALKSDLLHAGCKNVWGHGSQKSKNERIFEQLHKLSNGRLTLPAQATWLADFRVELLQYPQGKHDDQIDVVEAFLRCVDDLRMRLVHAGHAKAGDGFPHGLPGVPQLTIRVLNHGRPVHYV